MELSENDRQWLSDNYRTAIAKRQHQYAGPSHGFHSTMQAFDEDSFDDLETMTKLNDLRTEVAIRLIVQALEQLEQRLPDPNKPKGILARLRSWTGWRPTHNPSLASQFLEAAQNIYAVPGVYSYFETDMPQPENFQNNPSVLVEYLSDLAVLFSNAHELEAAKQLTLLAGRIEIALTASR